MRIAAAGLAILIYSAVLGQTSPPLQSPDSGRVGNPARRREVTPLSPPTKVGGDLKAAIGLLKYKGGGDWYSADRALRNLLVYLKSNTNVELGLESEPVEPSAEKLFTYPILFINGHGNIAFSVDDVANLRAYLLAGGFLFANDDYGMDVSFRREMKKVFPDAQWQELPFSHPIYHMLYNFPNGCPKIHKHDGLPAQGLGLYVNGVMVAFYDYQADICDGWEDESVHGDPPEKRRAAIEMGTNVVLYALSRGVE